MIHDFTLPLDKGPFYVGQQASPAAGWYLSEEQFGPEAGLDELERVRASAWACALINVRTGVHALDYGGAGIFDCDEVGDDDVPLLRIEPAPLMSVLADYAMHGDPKMEAELDNLVALEQESRSEGH